MKKAFTLIELIFVIIVIGIIATIALPNLNRNNLPKAAHQVVEHIRYTQHLAMVDDKFDSELPAAGIAPWYKKRWRIVFTTANDAGGVWAYSIFDDRTLGSAGNVGKPELAINPLNTSKFLSGGAAGGAIAAGDPDATDEMTIGTEYGIVDVTFTGGCAIGLTIAFDHLGRPLIGALSNYTTAYGNLLDATCTINLCTVNPCPVGNSDDKISIDIEPETGYVHIVP